MPKLNDAQRKWVDKFLGTRGGAISSDSGAETANLLETNVKQAMVGPYLHKQLEKAAQPKISPADVAKRRVGEPDWDKLEEDRKKKDNKSPGTEFGPNRKVVEDGDGRLSGNVEYDKLPQDLKDKLSQQFWGGLEKRQRQTLVETFRRMKAYGVWDQVKRVTGEKEKPEAHFKIRDWEFEVDGNSGGLTYEAYSGKGLVKKLIGTGHFGKDGEIIGREHKGQDSMREWRDNEPNVPTSLHISVGPGNIFDAHIDKVSPVSKPVGGKTRIDPFQGVKHRLSEVEAERVHKKTGIPLTAEVSKGENSEGKHETRFMVKLEVRGPVDKKKPKLSEKPVAANPVPEQALKKILQRVGRTKNYFPISVGTYPDDVPTPDGVASALAPVLLDAGRNNNNTVVADVAYYLDKTEDQPRALAMMREIGQIVRSELGPQAQAVTRLTVTFGIHKQGGTVSIAD